MRFLTILIPTLLSAAFSGPAALAASQDAPSNPARAASATIQSTHFLGIGICPPWKPMPTSACETAVHQMADALGHRLSIDPSDQTLLINASATTEGLVRVMAQLKATLTPADRLVIYATLHAGALDPSRPAGPDNDVMVLWSVEKPAVMAFAIAEDLWIRASDFAAMVHDLPAGEVVLILDACESAALTPLFLASHPANDPERPDAVVTSAKATQFANTTADRSLPLFSKELVEALGTKADKGTLRDAVTLAAERTVAEARPLCDALRATSRKDGLDPTGCYQEPVLADPNKLLSAMVLQ